MTHTPDNIRRLSADRDALMRLCDAQRQKIAKQANEIERLRTRVAKMQKTIDTLATSYNIGPDDAVVM